MLPSPPKIERKQSATPLFEFPHQIGQKVMKNLFTGGCGFLINGFRNDFVAGIQTVGRIRKAQLP